MIITTDWKKRCEMLEKKNENLEAHVSELEELILQLKGEFTKHSNIPMCFKFTKSEKQIFSILLAQKNATRDAIFNLHTLGYSEQETPNMKLIDVFVSKIRSKLAPHGIEIQTLYGSGWRITPEHKLKIAALLEAENSQEATAA